jgi:hypothetical protein
MGFQTYTGSGLELQNQVKCLGVILDSKLNSNSHIDYWLQKTTIALWQCRIADRADRFEFDEGLGKPFTIHLKRR